MGVNSILDLSDSTANGQKYLFITKWEILQAMFPSSITIPKLNNKVEKQLKQLQQVCIRQLYHLSWLLIQVFIRRLQEISMMDTTKHVNRSSVPGYQASATSLPSMLTCNYFDLAHTNLSYHMYLRHNIA